MHKAALILLAALAIPKNAAAEGFPIAGAGAYSCGKYLEARGTGADETRDAFFVSWLQGYLSRGNIGKSQADMILIPDYGSLLAYTDKFCRDNPLLYILGAAIQLEQDLQGQR